MESLKIHPQLLLDWTKPTSLDFMKLLKKKRRYLALISLQHLKYLKNPQLVKVPKSQFERVNRLQTSFYDVLSLEKITKTLQLFNIRSLKIFRSPSSYYPKVRTKNIPVVIQKTVKSFYVDLSNLENTKTLKLYYKWLKCCLRAISAPKGFSVIFPQKNDEVYEFLDKKESLLDSITNKGNLKTLGYFSFLLNPKCIENLKNNKVLEHIHLGIRNWLTYQQPLIHVTSLLSLFPLQTITVDFLRKSFDAIEFGQLLMTLSFIKSLRYLSLKMAINFQASSRGDFSSIFQRMKFLKKLKLQVTSISQNYHSFFYYLIPISCLVECSISLVLEYYKGIAALKTLPDLLGKLTLTKKLNLELYPFQDCQTKMRFEITEAIIEALSNSKSLEKLSLAFFGETDFSTITKAQQKRGFKVGQMIKALHNLQFLKIKGELLKEFGSDREEVEFYNILFLTKPFRGK